MYSRFLFFILAFFMTQPDAQTLTFRDILNKPELAQTTPDHKLAYGAHRDQYAELWLPTPRTKTNAPVVILIHGGCWRADLPGPELVAFLADDLRKRGVAVWSITYRRVGTKADNFSPYPDTFLDIANAIDKLREIGPKYGLDLAHIVATGHSAGGHLALWAAARARIASTSPLFMKNALPIQRVVGIAAIPDLAFFSKVGAHACGDDTIDLLTDTAKRGKPAAYADTSPAVMLPLGVSQHLMHGVFDGIVPPSVGLAYRTRAEKAGENIRLTALEASGHFELIAPWTVPGRAVVDAIIAASKLR